MTEITPLELRKAYDARSKSLLPALSLQRTVKLLFVRFVPPTDEFDSQNATFDEQIKMICGDLDELLSFDFEQFWCQMLYNQSLRKCLRSVLIWTPRCDRPIGSHLRNLTSRGFQNNPLTESCRADYHNLLNLILSVFSRSSKPQESNTEFISKNKFGELIYDHYVFDLPLLMDICAIYFHLATADVISILSNVFTYEERYLNDLKMTLAMLSEIFDRVEQEINAPEKLKGFDRLQDLTFYIGDICWSLFAFFNVISQLTTSTPSDLCFSSSIHEKLPSLYEHSVVPLRKAIEADLEITPSEHQTLLAQLSKASVWLITTVRSAFCEPYLLNPIRQSTEKPSSSRSTERTTLGQRYLDFMIQLLNYRNFSLAYQLLYPFEQDLVLIQRTVGRQCLDDAAVQYVRGAIESLFTETGVARQSPFIDIYKVPPTEQSSGITPQAGPSIDGPLREVREILPDMDIDLIKRCLDAFDQDSARVINAALEGSIPEHLLNPDEPQSLSNGQTGGFLEELNTLRAVDQLRIPQLKPDQVWQGKRDDVESLPDLSKRLKQVTIRSAVSIWEDVEDDERGTCSHPDDLVGSQPLNTVDAYEDEYDDTYDVHEGAVDDVGSSAESDSPEPSDVQSVTTQAQRQWHKYPNSSGSSNPHQSNTTVLPIPNPEVIREQQHIQRAFRRGRFNPRNPAPPVPHPGWQRLRTPCFPPSNRPSTDKPAGSQSGQTSEPNHRIDETSSTSGVSRTAASDRLYKTAHKARFANHNRRRLADKKRQF